METKTNNIFSFFRILKYVFFFFILLILLLAINPFVNIEAGHRGVLFDKLRDGVQTGSMDEGLHFIVPFFQSVVQIPVRTQRVIFSGMDYSMNTNVMVYDNDFYNENPYDKRYQRLSAATADLQDVYVDAILTYHIDPKYVAKVYQDFGADYQSKKVVPRTVDAVKTYTAKYKVAEILTKREDIKKQVFEYLKKELEKDHMIVEDINLTNFDFNAQFKESIEQKQIEEQKAQKEEYILKQKEIQVQQRIKEAEANKQSKVLEGEGIAEYNKLIQQEISDNVLEYKRLENMKNAIEKWNGAYPTTYFGGGENNAVPLINLQ